MLLALLWLYYITFWPVSKTYFSTPLEVVAKFFFAACGGKEGGRSEDTSRSAKGLAAPWNPAFILG